MHTRRLLELPSHYTLHNLAFVYKMTMRHISVTLFQIMNQKHDIVHLCIPQNVCMATANDFGLGVFGAVSRNEIEFWCA